MKHFLKLLALSFTLFGAMSFSQSALANNCYCLAGIDVGGGMCGVPNANGSGFQHMEPMVCDGSGSSRGYLVKYLALMWTKDGEPFFDKTTHSTPTLGYFDFESADHLALRKCNSKASRSPCRMATSVKNMCIAVAKSNTTTDLGVPYYYAMEGETCRIAKQEAIKLCQAKASNPSSCKAYKAQHS